MARQWKPLSPPDGTEGRHDYFTQLHDAIVEVREAIDAADADKPAAEAADPKRSK